MSNEKNSKYIQRYQKRIDQSKDDEARLIHCLARLDRDWMTMKLLEDTLVGRTVYGLCEYDGKVGTTATELIEKWKDVVRRDMALQEADDTGEDIRHTKKCDPTKMYKSGIIVNQFSNQLIIQVAEEAWKCTHIMCEIFPGQIRHVFQRPNYSKNDLEEILRKHIDLEQANCIFAPIKIAQMCEKIVKANFSKNIKLDYSNVLLPDIISCTTQTEFIKRIHDKTPGNFEQIYQEAKKTGHFPDMNEKIASFVENCECCKSNVHEQVSRERNPKDKDLKRKRSSKDEELSASKRVKTSKSGSETPIKIVKASDAPSENKSKNSKPAKPRKAPLMAKLLRSLKGRR